MHKLIVPDNRLFFERTEVTLVVATKAVSLAQLTFVLLTISTHRLVEATNFFSPCKLTALTQTNEVPQDACGTLTNPCYPDVRPRRIEIDMIGSRR